MHVNIKPNRVKVTPTIIILNFIIIFDDKIEFCKN